MWIFIKFLRCFKIFIENKIPNQEKKKKKKALSAYAYFTKPYVFLIILQENILFIKLVDYWYFWMGPRTYVNNKVRHSCKQVLYQDFS